MDPTTETKNPILTFDEEFDTSTSDAARRVLDTPDIPPTVPASLSDALRQDGRALFESFVPKSQAAAERRGEIAANIRNFGKNVLSVAGITVVLGAGLAVAASAVDTYILAPVEVGKVEVTQKNGQGLQATIVDGLQQISESTGNDVTGADYRDGVSDITNAGVPPEGFAGLGVEVTAYESPIFHTPTVEAEPLVAPQTVDAPTTDNK
jgi:hypothetical protein